jgi:hypothetical protein
VESMTQARTLANAWGSALRRRTEVAYGAGVIAAATAGDATAARRQRGWLAVRGAGGDGMLNNRADWRRARGCVLALLAWVIVADRTHLGARSQCEVGAIVDGL